MAFVYLLTNRSMPGTVKIGCTARLPERRAAELYTTGVPTPFVVAAYWHADDAKLMKVEADVHALLDSFRVHRHREFFQIEADDAKARIGRFLGTYEQLEKRRAEDAARAERAAHESSIRAAEYRAAQDAMQSWEQVKEKLWAQANIEAGRPFGKSLDEINRMENTLANGLSTLAWGLLWVFTLGVVPIVLFLLGADPETRTSKSVNELRKEFFGVRDRIFKMYRHTHFESRGMQYPFDDNQPV